MAGEGRTVRVSGFPVDMPENRLSDKIYIHFLRKRNNGGEISSVNFSKSSPGTAFITFEENRVASRLAKQGKQVFNVNDKSYDVIIRLHCEEVGPDEVFVDMSVTVDHSKLPEGKRTLLNLHKHFSGVHLTFDPKTDLCTLKGSYSDVRSLSKLVLGSVKSQKQNSDDRLPSNILSQKKCDLPLEKTENNFIGGNEVAEVIKDAKRPEAFDMKIESPVWNTGLAQSSSYLHQASDEALSEDRWDIEPEDETTLEDSSMVVDSDIFRYLHKYCNKEYQGILRRHRVEVVDMTSEGITTLYLNQKKTLSECGRSSVKKAQQQLAHLYQEKGSQLRKENISKSGIPQKDLDHALESLQQRLPKLMIEEDEENVCMVGSKSDVSEAKQFITDAKGIRMDEDICSNQPFSSPQPSFTYINPGGSVLSEHLNSSDSFRQQGDRFKEMEDDLFNPRKDSQKEKKEEIHNDTKSFSDYTQYRLQASKAKMDEILFSARRNFDTSEETHVQSDFIKMDHSVWYDRDKYTSPLFASSKPSPVFSTVDLYKRSPDNPDFISEETKPNWQPDTTLSYSEKQLKSSKEQKTKKGDSGRELKMAPNFMRDMSSHIMESGCIPGDRKSTEDQKITRKHEHGLSVNEIIPPDSRQAYSVPFIKPSMNNNLKLNSSPGELGGKGSGLSKMDVQGLKGDLNKPGQFSLTSSEKKPPVMPAYSSVSQNIALSHMDLCGDPSVSKRPTMLPGSARRRSNSFSGKIKKGPDEQPAVDLFAGERVRSQSSQTKEMLTMDVLVSLKLWLYLRSVYNTEFENLTSDLQVIEKHSKEDTTLCLRGASSEKVIECHHGLKSLIATIESDFDTRTFPLSLLGLTDCKDKTLIDFCTLMKQTHEKVKIVVMSKTVMILGSKSECKEVEAAMMETFCTRVSGDMAKVESLRLYEPKCVPCTANSDSKSLFVTNHPTPTSDSGPNTTKMSDASKTDIIRDAALDATSNGNRQQENHGGSWGTMEREQEADKSSRLLAKQGYALKGRLGENLTMKNGITGTEREAEDKAGGDHETMPALQKNTDVQRNSQIKGTLTEQMSPGVSVDQMRDVAQPPGVSEVMVSGLPSKDLLLSCVCGVQNSTVKRTGCGTNLCFQCRNDVHADCRVCPPETNRDARGIKGTMSIRESTITIPGFLRDTTLKIIYDIPDGIQGEGHPCPGSPFKGNRFEAYLPHNSDTKKLLPLLDKAFLKGHTFTVKAGLPVQQGKDGDVQWQVSWGIIPHKTNTDGGASKNGYPDSSYIRRLTEALRIVGLGE